MQVNLDEFCDKHDLKALSTTSRCSKSMRRASTTLPEPAAVDAAEANPEVMVEAAFIGDMAVVRKQLKAGVAVDAVGGGRRDRADPGG